MTRSPRSTHPDNRKVYSSSVKYKYNERATSPNASVSNSSGGGGSGSGAVKKPRSFIADMLPVPKMMEYEGGGGAGPAYSWEAGTRYADEGMRPGQRSPRLSQSIKLTASSGSSGGSGHARAFERRTSSLGYDVSPGANSNSNISLINSGANSMGQIDVDDYDAVLRSYQRKSLRKGSSSASSRPGSHKMPVKKKLSDAEAAVAGDSFESVGGGGGSHIGVGVGVGGSVGASSAGGIAGPAGKDNKLRQSEEDAASLRKRKRIICIITTVFFSLVIASVCVVVVMLTHTSGYSTGSSQPKKNYVARGSPIHYNINSEYQKGYMIWVLVDWMGEM